MAHLEIQRNTTTVSRSQLLYSFTYIFYWMIFFLHRYPLWSDQLSVIYSCSFQKKKKGGCIQQCFELVLRIKLNVSLIGNQEIDIKYMKQSISCTYLAMFRSPFTNCVLILIKDLMSEQWVSNVHFQTILENHCIMASYYIHRKIP